MQEVSLDLIKSLVFDFVEEKVTKANFVEIILEYINILQAKDERNDVVYTERSLNLTNKEDIKLIQKFILEMRDNREMPLVTSKDAERFMTNVRKNNEFMKQRIENRK